MKLFTLFAALLSLAPLTSSATVYDEISSENPLEIIGNVETEQQLVSSPNDIYRARLVVIINKANSGSSAQTMKVYLEGRLIHEWLVSTGREKTEKAKSGRVYRTTTPVGYFRPTKLDESYFSNTWKAPMPHAVFFIGGVAIHASTHIEQLGQRASGGCVRLAPENAATLFNLILAIGMNDVPSIDRTGKPVLTPEGSPLITPGWDTLIIVENHI